MDESFGRYTSLIPSRRDKGTEVLLISCDVSPKWINSPIFSSALPEILSFIKYSTAFTSWFVIFSISLILRASSIENFPEISLRRDFSLSVTDFS
jgi:hypothetical protein